MPSPVRLDLSVARLGQVNRSTLSTSGPIRISGTTPGTRASIASVHARVYALAHVRRTEMERGEEEEEEEEEEESP